jgi:hypothetical protein
MKKSLCLILFFVSVFVFGQAPQKFYTRFGGYGHDIGYGVIQTLNGQYAVTGSTGSFGNGNTDVYLALVDSMGWVRWENSYGGFNNDIGRSIIQLPDSGFVITGYTNSFGNGGYDVLVVRTDKNGTLIWQKAYGGLDWDFGYCVKATTGNDSLIVAGSTYSYGYGKMDGYILKLDLLGNLQWQKTYGGAEDDEFKSFVLTATNQFAFGGTTKSMGDINGDSWLVKTGLAGDSVFSYKYGNSKRQFINKMVQAPNTDFVMCGGFDSTAVDSSWSYLLSVHQNGSFFFQDAFSKHNMKDQQFTAITTAKTVDYIYCEKAFNSPVGFKLEPTVCLFKGSFYQYCTTYGGISDEIIYDISNTRDKGYIAVGQTDGLNAILNDVFLVKMDSTVLSSMKIEGINEPIKFNKNYASVFPTLTNSDLYIDITDQLKTPNLTLLDALGNLVYETEIRNKSQKLDISTLPTGFYFLRISEHNFSQTFKIIKTD